MIALTTLHLKKGDKVRLTGRHPSGVEAGAGIGRNPPTGAALRIEVSKKTTFRRPKNSRSRSESAQNERFDSHQNYRIAVGHP
jgi:hypothetical protein